jgi:hypothetical protein
MPVSHAKYPLPQAGLLSPRVVFVLTGVLPLLMAMDQVILISGHDTLLLTRLEPSAMPC